MQNRIQTLDIIDTEDLKISKRFQDILTNVCGLKTGNVATQMAGVQFLVVSPVAVLEHNRRDYTRSKDIYIHIHSQRHTLINIRTLLFYMLPNHIQNTHMIYVTVRRKEISLISLSLSSPDVTRMKCRMCRFIIITSFYYLAFISFTLILSLSI